MLIGEVYLPLHRLMAYYGNDLSGAQMPFNFALLSTFWSARSIEQIIHDYEKALPKGAWPNWVLGNHDRPRVASRVGAEQARVAAMLLLTLRGTPTLYYGDEIGMHQLAIAPEDVRDPFEKNVPGIGVGRDGCRTPMQWDSSQFAGFSKRSPGCRCPRSCPRERRQSRRRHALDSQPLQGVSLRCGKLPAAGGRRLSSDRHARRSLDLSP